MEIDVQKFWADGYLVVQNVFSPREILRWRERALSAAPKGDLLSDSVLCELILDERLVSTARTILNASPVYFGDSTASIGYQGWGFHKDNSDRLDGNAPDWGEERYPIIRFGIYGQSHGRNPGGLELRRGSHNIADFTSGEHVSPAVELGDMIVWNFRTTHSAGARKLKLLGISIPHNRLWDGLDSRIGLKWALQEPKETRLGLFASYAKEHPLLDRHLEYLKQRTYAWDMWKNIRWESQQRTLAEDRGLKLIDPSCFEYDGRATHDWYHPLAY